jgi:uncharacterized membrane protein
LADDISSNAPTTGAAPTGNGESTAAKNGSEFWLQLRIPNFKHNHPPVRNANDVHSDQLTPLERLAAKITDKVGSMGFFFGILCWTVIWCGFNLICTEVKPLNKLAFDPFPAFVAYLLISNVIQILLMPLIMVGQNVQGRHSEIRAELDFEINQKAEKEVAVILHHLEHNTRLLLHLMKHLECRVSEEELKVLAAETELAAKIAELSTKAGAAAAAITDATVASTPAAS